MDRSWLWSALMGLGVVACLQEDKPGDTAEDDDEDPEDSEDTDGPGELSDYFEDDGESEGGGDGSGSSGDGGSTKGCLSGMAEVVCEMYDDCGIMEYYFGDMSTCVDTVQSYYESYGCTPGSTFDECIDEIQAGGCDYYYYGGSGACYYALECSGAYYYYYAYYYY